MGTAISAGSMFTGGGYGDTGITITNDGIVCLNHDFSVNGNVTLGGLFMDGPSALVGGGSIGGSSGNTGIAITDDNLAVDGTSTLAGSMSIGTSTLAGSMSIGGGYGDTGVTITNDGIVCLQLWMEPQPWQELCG